MTRGVVAAGAAMFVPAVGCLLFSHVLAGVGFGTLTPTFGGVGGPLIPVSQVAVGVGVLLTLMHMAAAVAAPVLVGVLRRGRFTSADRVLVSVWLSFSAAAAAGALPMFLAAGVTFVVGAVWVSQTAESTTSYSRQPGFVLTTTGLAWAVACGWIWLMGMAGLATGAAVVFLGENVLGL